MKKFLNLNLIVAIVLSGLLYNCAGTKKAKVDPYIGSWEYTAQTDNGNLDVVMKIEKAEDGYVGSLNSDMGSVDLQDLKIEDGQMTGWFEMQGYELSIKGTFEDTKFTGITSIDTYEMEMNATKVVTD